MDEKLGLDQGMKDEGTKIRNLSTFSMHIFSIVGETSIIHKKKHRNLRQIQIKLAHYNLAANLQSKAINVHQTAKIYKQNQ